MTDKALKIRPYARLLTMLGEQLIKNERIALIELIKNSYDADAKWVKINFVNFKNNYAIQNNSKIIIEDSGYGMSEKIIKEHWLNPATPEKMNRKKIKNTTESGRIIQGEKGIGRFAILKLGRKIKLYTRAKGESSEQKIVYDFEKYDDDFLTENGKEKELFIDDLSVDFESRKPKQILSKSITLGRENIEREPFGTTIEITNLKGKWTEKKVQDVARDILSLQSIFTTKDDKVKKHPLDKFRVFIHKDDEFKDYVKSQLDNLHILLQESSVLKVEDGFFDSEKKEFHFKIKTHNSDKSINKTIKLSDPTLTGMKVYKDYFIYSDAKKVKHNYLDERSLECGSFGFSFYAFDLDSSDKVPAKFKVSKEDKLILKDHRVYLYRDGIRVYPYGESDDDWLRVDALRGTISVGAFLSNDQMVGKIDISQEANPKLKDKTNREGLIEDGNALGDFIVLIQLFLHYLRKKPYNRYRIDIQEKYNLNELKKKKVEVKFTELRKAAGSNKKILSLLDKAHGEYLREKEYFQKRTKLTEDLAGVGLSVETASHDLKGMMDKVLINLDGLIRDLMMGDNISNEIILKELQSVRGGVSFIEAQIKDIQLLFRSNRQRRRNIRVIEIIEKVKRIYKRVLTKHSIKLEIITDNQPLVAKTTDAILLQLLLNLFDNSVYWLQECVGVERAIKITLKGSEGIMIFSDNGPGIENGDESYIFEAFYSGKAEDGKGLGLYIARQLLERNDYSIDLIIHKSHKILSGANFKIDFNEGSLN